MFRKMISITLLVSLVALSSSGILMIVLDSLAFQLQMHPVHKIFGILLTISGIGHLYYNLGAIKKYLGTKKIAIYLTGLTFLLVLLYGIGVSKPLDMDKVHQIEQIMQTMEG